MCVCVFALEGVLSRLGLGVGRPTPVARNKLCVLADGRKSETDPLSGDRFNML